MLQQAQLHLSLDYAEARRVQLSQQGHHSIQDIGPAHRRPTAAGAGSVPLRLLLLLLIPADTCCCVLACLLRATRQPHLGLLLMLLQVGLVCLLPEAWKAAVLAIQLLPRHVSSSLTKACHDIQACATGIAQVPGCHAVAA